MQGSPHQTYSGIFPLFSPNLSSPFLDVNSEVHHLATGCHHPCVMKAVARAAPGSSCLLLLWPHNCIYSSVKRLASCQLSRHF
jgi:hypothetical protein